MAGVSVHKAAEPSLWRRLPLSARWCVLALATGFALQLQQPQLWPQAVYSGLLLSALAGLAVLVWRARQPSWAVPAAASQGVVLLLIACMAFAWAGWRAAWFNASALPAQWHGLDVQVTGVVASLPRLQEGVLRFRFEPEAAVAVQGGQAIDLQQLMDVAWYASNSKSAQALEPAATAVAHLGEGDDGRSGAAAEPVRAGDRWRLSLRLRQPSGLRNPGTFDYEQWLWQQGVQATAYVRDGARDAAPVWLGDTGRYGLERLRQQVRDRLLGSLQHSEHAATALEQRSVGILAALVTGDQRSIDQADWEVFRITGVAHLMAISGVHITMFAWLAMLCVGWLWRRCLPLMLWRPAAIAAAWGGFVLALAYALFSGWQLPAQRTVLMLAVWVVISTRGVRWPWYASLSLAGAVVLVLDPWALQQPGFWLSFVAVGVLLNLASQQGAQQPSRASTPIASAPAAAADAATLVSSHKSWLSWRALHQSGVGKMQQFWQLQWRLTVLLIPLTVSLFGQISWSGLVANLLAIPVVSWVVTPLAMLGVWFEPALVLAKWTMTALLAVLAWIAQWPYSAVFWPIVPWYWAGLGLLAALCWLGPWPAWLRLLGALVFALMLAWRPAPLPFGVFEVVALDVGQGGGVLIKTRQHAMLFDAGPGYLGAGDAGERVVLPALQSWGVVPELLVLSHNHNDHTGGAAALMRAFPAMRVLAPFPQALLPLRASSALVPGRSEELDLSSRMSWCQQGLKWNWDGVEFEFLYPSALQLAQWWSASGDQTPQTPNANATSCVMRVSTAQAAALLTGDIGRLQELELLLANAEQLKADWLQLPHHGSRSSSSERFVAAVAPRYAIAQTGFANQFNHPRPEVVQRYVLAGARVIESPQCGASFWQSLQPESIVCDRAQRRRYWQRPSAG
ncbi:DNA internalization-related competence protein ComEC/Rec2 [Lampropedia aestuarii]|uniref:DNA internalization-related competence protein ComEC/Rec2 n=1 Tax=Lampropedia aestuarii TaxID=2562762 RepID=UPI0024694A3B|nr:DNA internalization-related competence protein ComEC/Rec2 [Lampropedia aestuarii]MDH5855864.1 DNA internalization-related competence protein ComEC/Rec2 [Lampropedia aestuarii]